MRIHILNGYRGERTNEQFLAPGVHEVADDLGVYLIANGHARAVETETAAAVEVAPVVPVEDAVTAEVEPVAVDPAVDYESFTTAELRELAEAQGLEVVGTGSKGAILKADYIRALLGAEA